MKTFMLAIFAIASMFMAFPQAAQADSLESIADASSSSIVLTIDTSDSMWGAPMERTREAAAYFVEHAPPDTPIAIVTFAGTANVVLNYTTDRADLLRAIQSLTPGGVTALYDGSMQAVRLASQSTADNRVVILMSDGAEYGGASSAGRTDALQLAQSFGIKVHTVGLGFGADRSFLQELATGTTANAYEAPEPTSLLGIYDELSTAIASNTSTETDAVASASPAPDLQTVNYRPLNDVYVPYADVDKSTTNPTDTTSDLSVNEPVDIVAPLDNTEQSVVRQAPDIATTTVATHIVLAIDTSDSMWGTPMDSARQAARDFVQQIDGNIPVALMTFSDRAEVAIDFTTHTPELVAMIDSLQPGGVTALYDGSYDAVELAASTNGENPVVILLSDGAEYGNVSRAARSDALAYARANGVTVYAVGLGFGADRTFLEELASGTDGLLYNAPDSAALASIYEELGESLLLARATAPNASNQIIAPLAQQVSSEPDLTLLRVRSDVPLIGSLEVPDSIAPLNAEIMSLNLELGSSDDSATEETTGSLNSDTGEQSGLSDNTNALPLTRDDIITPETLEPGDVELVSNVAPISIEVTDDMNIESAELSINDVLLAVFQNPPYVYDLDTSKLTQGTYRLTFHTVNDKNVASTGTFEFDVTLGTPAPAVEPGESVDAETGDTVSLVSRSALAIPRQNTPTIDASTAPRVITVNGERADLNLKFTPNEGLTLRAPATGIAAAATQSLGDILARPANLVPEPIREWLNTPRPEFVSLFIIVVTIILLPQGIFTLYYMTYTWVHPKRLEQSASPREFYEPQHSFTALVPARKEEAVIYQTVQAVNGINYPDHLKETLILIRDEDDDETIAEAKRAIEDIRRSYEERGEAYPDNVHLITFTDGPKNKPNGLNRGYRASTKDVVCIFDAEDSPHDDIYNVINTVMLRDNADVVQSGVQLMNFKSTWFSALNCLEYFFWFKSGLHAFTHALGVTPLGGNTVFFKREWLDKLAAEDTEKGYRAWDENCLTEDADVGIRLTALGAKIQIVYDAEHATQEETPATVEQLIKQRTRWVQGFYEVFFKGDWLKLPKLKQKVTALYILLNSLLQAFTIFFLPFGILIALTQRIPVPLAMLSYFPIYLLVMQLIINLSGIREFTEAYGLKLPFLFRLKMILYFYPYNLLLGFAAMRAMFRFITRQSAWEKTTHANLHRQAQPVTGAA